MPLFFKKAIAFFKIAFAYILLALVLGLVGFALSKGIEVSTQFRTAHPVMIYFLVPAGLLSVLVFKLLGVKGSRNDMVLAAKGESKASFSLAPAVFVSTLFSHITGASVGREGAALQIGGSLSAFVGKLFGLDKKQTALLIGAGMAAMFAAVFGTPLAAAVFVFELIGFSKGTLKRIIPTFFLSFSAFLVCMLLGGKKETFHIRETPVFSWQTALKVLALAAVSGIVGLVFSICVKYGKILFRRFFVNEYLRITVGALAILLLTMPFGTTLYNGAGSGIVEGIFEGETVPSFAFLLKILFTVLALSSGFQGGEIVPTLFVGATLGAAAAVVLALPVGFCAAIGMAVLFCAITKCPLASIVLAAEIFPLGVIWYIIPAVLIGYLISRKNV